MYLFVARIRLWLSESIANSEPNNSESSSESKHSAMDPWQFDFTGKKDSCCSPPLKSTVADEDWTTCTAKITEIARKAQKIELPIFVGSVFRSIGKREGTNYEVEVISDGCCQIATRCRAYLLVVPLPLDVTGVCLRFKSVNSFIDTH
ncbi:hypothetical protein L6164_012549 [Bauhinia variegata]|uniref:Uncharacterized protein n=1 Tax=Bauhinia variegata TaxID=167791 RepID=A0ACB9PAG5_BAUVA|nr:hypothetical protein L6164_012549 [Bauhinia variegata]